MKKEEIENRDQELIKKFRTIINNNEITPAPKRFPLALIFLFTALIISSILLLKQQPAMFFPKVSKTSSLAQVVTIPAEQLALKADAIKMKASPDIQKALPSSQKMMDQETVPKSSGSDFSTPVIEQDSPAEISNQRVQGDMPSGISIEEIISCGSVNNKQYNKPKNKFSLAQNATPTIWMKVISENPPFTLTHVYYCNGRKYCKVSLDIRYHRMRTWSSVTLRSPDHIGKWRVEVIDGSGAKLDQIEFIVVK